MSGSYPPPQQPGPQGPQGPPPGWQPQGPPMQGPPPQGPPPYGQPSQGPPMQGPPMQGPPPQGSPMPGPPMGQPKKSRKGLFIVIAAFVLVLGAVGVGMFIFGAQGPHEQTKGSGGDTKALGIDDPRPKPTVSSPGGDGGAMGKSLANALKTNQFDCTTTRGFKMAVLSCFRSLKQPVPNVQKVTARIVEDQLVDVSASVEPDPAWVGLDADANSPFTKYNPDPRDAAWQAFGIVSAAVIPDGERPQLEVAMRKAYKKAKDVTTSVGKVRVRMAATHSGFQFTPLVKGEKPEFRGVPSGLSFVTPAEIEQAVKQTGATCKRDTESMTCSQGDLKVVASYPAPNNELGDHNIVSLEVTARAIAKGAPSPLQVTAVKAIEDLLLSKWGEDANPVKDWTDDCFGFATKGFVAGHTQFACQGTLGGKVKSPDIKSYTFFAGALDN